MAKNYMQDVAKMLGVELEEEFNIEERGKTLYRLTEKGLSCLTILSGWEKQEDYTLAALLYGKLEIKKLPWEPKNGEVYCRPGSGFEDVAFDIWGNHPIDFALKEAGMIFKTKAECEAALPALRKKYLGGDDNV